MNQPTPQTSSQLMARILEDALVHALQPVMNKLNRLEMKQTQAEEHVTTALETLISISSRQTQRQNELSEVVEELSEVVEELSDVVERQTQRQAELSNVLEKLSDLLESDENL